MRIYDLQASFNAGEISERLAARLDFVKYPLALETCENLIPTVEGGAMRRAATRYVAEVKSSAVKGRLKPFQFSVTQAYMLELGATIMRFYRHQGQITVADTDAVVTNGTFPSNITGWDDRSTGAGSIAHDATNGRLSLVPGGATASDIGWAEQDITTTNTNQEHVLKFKVIGAPGDKIEFQVGTAASGAQTLAAVEKEVGYHCVAFTPTTSPFYIQFRNRGDFRNKTVQIDDVSLIDNAGVEVDTPFSEANLYTVEHTQSADVMYFFHESYPTHKLIRNGHTTWSLVEVEWEDGPYLSENGTAVTLLPSAATGLGINLTLSAITAVNDGQGWLSTDIGRLVRYKKSAAWGYAVITSITSTTIAVADVRKDFEATPTAVTTWKIGSWSGTTGYPKVGTFYEQRLYAAATTDFPQTFWASQTGDFQNMKPDDDADTVAADDALEFTLSADDVNEIRWMSAGEADLAIGTSGGEWVPSASGAAITPLDITCRRRTKKGSARIKPVRIGNKVIFVQRAKRKIYEFGQSFESNGYKSIDLTQLASHIGRANGVNDTDGFVEMDYADEPESLIWAARGDGQLCTMTYKREEDVVGLARQIIGGSFQGGNAVAESVAVIPGANGSGQYYDSTQRDEVWLIVKRTINGATKRFIEFIERDYETGLPQEDAYYSDSIITLDSPETISGATAASPVVLTITGTTFANGDLIRVTEVLGMTELNGNTYKVANKATNSVELTDPDDDSNIDGTAFTAYISGGKANKKVTAVSGLDHLEGETVNVLGDGGIITDEIVASGAITLDEAVSVAQIGLPYTHKLKTLKVSQGNPAGTALGRTKRIYGLVFSLLNSFILKFGPSSTELTSEDFRKVSDPMDEAAPLFTGDYETTFPSDWNKDPRIFIEDDSPTPFHLLALSPLIKVNTK